MCHRALILDREELAWAARRRLPERETTKRRRLGEGTSASLLGLAEAPGKQQFDRFFVADSCWRSSSIFACEEMLIRYYARAMYSLSGVLIDFRVRSGIL
jgi:hypothetical protein